MTRNKRFVMSEPARKKRKDSKKVHVSQKKGNIEGTDTWEVESIVDYRIAPGMSTADVEGAKRVVYFAVKWRGYGDEDITLEPVTNLVQSMHLVKKFLKEKGKRLEVDPDSMEAWIVDDDPPKKEK